MQPHPRYPAQQLRPIRPLVARRNHRLLRTIVREIGASSFWRTVSSHLGALLITLPQWCRTCTPRVPRPIDPSREIRLIPIRPTRRSSQARSLRIARGRTPVTKTALLRLNNSRQDVASYKFPDDGVPKRRHQLPTITLTRPPLTLITRVAGDSPSREEEAS